MSGKILLTGGGGMVGRNVLDLARAKGMDVLAPASSELNLLDAGAVIDYLRRHRPDCILHSAGRVGGIQANIKEPVAFLVQNWDMGRNLIMAAREVGIRRLINLGSSCMYPRNSPDALRESDVLTGELEPTNEGYALAKISVARLCDYVSRENPEFQFKTLIPSNIYGPYDKFDPARSHLVPAIIHKLHTAKVSGQSNVVIWGDGLARREFMYAGDLADAIVNAIERFESLPSLMNVGIGYDYTVNEYYETAAKIMGYEGSFEHDLSKPVGMARKLTDVAVAKGWGWQAKTSLHDGLKATYEYYLNSGVADAISVG